MARRAAKIDGNQPAIVAALIGLGCSVAITSSQGDGFPDLAIAYGGPDGVTCLAEIKDPAQPLNKQQLRPKQKKFHAAWRGKVIILRTLDDAIQLASLLKKQYHHMLRMTK